MDNEPSWLRDDPVPVQPPAESSQLLPKTPSSSSSSSSSSYKDDVHHDCCHDCCASWGDGVLTTFRVWHIFSAITAGVCLFINAYYIYNNYDIEGWRDIALRIYAMLLSLLAVLIETDLNFIMKYIRLLSSWFVRGLLALLIGFITVDGSNTVDGDPNDIVGFTEIAVGLVYLILAISCLEEVQRVRYEKYYGSKHAA